MAWRRRVVAGDRASVGSGTVDGLSRGRPQRRPAPLSGLPGRPGGRARARRPKPAKLATL